MLVLSGLFLLASVPVNSTAAVGLGLLALLWYNGFYTYLKRVTAFAVVPGAVIGAIPPVIGWVAAGGHWNDSGSLMLAFFMFLWQIPHFWLLALMYGDQYADAGMPTPTKVFTREQLARVTYMWILGVAVAGLACGAMAPQRLGLPWNAVLVAGSIWLPLKGLGIFRNDGGETRRRYLRAFMQINLYALLVILCLMLSAFGLAL